MVPFGSLAASRLSYATGTAGTVTVASGFQVIGVSCVSIGGGTLTITPGGANQTGVAGGAIPLVAGVGYTIDLPAVLAQLGGGSVFVFAGTDSYTVWYAQPKAG